MGKKLHGHSSKSKILIFDSRKKAKSLKEKAKKDYEKSHKQYVKRQSKAELIAEKELKKLAKMWDQGYAEEVNTMPHRPSNVLWSIKQKMTRSTSHGKFLLTSCTKPHLKECLVILPGEAEGYVTLN